MEKSERKYNYVIPKDKEWLQGRTKLVTGFCHHGWHEGTRPRNYKDDPVPTCHLYLTCPCSCHKELDDMYELAGMDRILITNPEWVRPPSTFTLPTPEEVAELKRQRAEAEGRARVTEANPEDVLSGKAFHNTESGVRAKGQLEYQVFVACANLCWPSAMCDITDMTPKFIAEYIATHQQIEPPSSGAIQAAWDRWKKYGLIEDYGRKPVRFTGFVDDFDERPVAGDLEAYRDRYKHKRKLQKNDDRRNLIRRK